MKTFANIVLSTLALAAFAAPTLANGRNPGSLIIYPEYRFGNGLDTVLTVTNTNPTTGIRVHMFYVSGDTANLCQTNNRTINLAARGTCTVLVSAHLGAFPAVQKGYVYAYAENPAGQAISFNWLAGDLLQVDGLPGALNAEYSVEVVPFNSPKPENTVTASDTDNVLDLNDVEYEQAPARVLVPRFMGQATAAEGFRSDLILIGLSGGARFSTIVDFIVFNDNEEAFSAQAQFACWTKQPLLTINGIFSNTFLHDFTNDDPNDIGGVPTQEAGWFWVDGHVAFSTANDIQDPAVLAVLVERSPGTTNEFAAELPFFQGKQRGGDLLPAGLTWDQD
jgi:hypothetical protein